MTRKRFTIYLDLGGFEYEIYSLSTYEACVRMIDNELRPYMRDNVKYHIREFNVETHDTIID